MPIGPEKPPARQLCSGHCPGLAGVVRPPSSTALARGTGQSKKRLGYSAIADAETQDSDPLDFQESRNDKCQQRKAPPSGVFGGSEFGTPEPQGN